MLPHHGAVAEHERAAAYLLLKPVDTVLQEPRVVVVRDEADLVGVRLVGYVVEAELRRHLADLRLLVRAKGEDRAGEVLLRQAPERVALVLVAVEPTAQEVAVPFVVVTDVGVVARGDVLAVQIVGPLQQGVPLDVGVTEHTGVGRAAREVLVGETLDHPVPKLLPQVHDEVRKAVLSRHHTGVVHRLDGAAAHFFSVAPPAGGIVPGFHGEAHYVVAALFEQHGRHRGVDAATHGDEHASLLAHDLGGESKEKTAGT